MMRRVIEYLRRKQNITIDDLVVEICSNTMYYKYLSKEKNMSCKKLRFIKERLGADDLTQEEIREFKKDLDKIIHNIMRYYISKEAFEKDIAPLIELEPQLLLCDELCIDYMIAKINFLLLENNLDEISKLLNLLEEFFDKMSVTQQLFYYHLKIFLFNYLKEDIKDLVNDFAILLENNRYNKDYGFFHMSLVFSYIKLKLREKAYHAIEITLSLFVRDLNLIGQVRVTNMKAVILGESRKYNEVLELLIPNYNNAKQINIVSEMFNSLTNIITCYLGINNKQLAIKYWKILKNTILDKYDSKVVSVLLINNAISLFTNFEYYQMLDELSELVKMLEKFVSIDNEVLNNLIEYYYINNVDDQVEYIENKMLNLLTGKAHFSYCKWMLDTCVRYYKQKRLYKKAVNFETKYLLEFKKYYFN